MCRLFFSPFGWSICFELSNLISRCPPIASVDVDALDLTLATCVLPHATRAPADSVADALADTAVSSLLCAFSAPLKAAFQAICTSPTLISRPRTWQEVPDRCSGISPGFPYAHGLCLCVEWQVCTNNAVVAWPEFLKLAEVFVITPKLIPKAALMKISIPLLPSSHTYFAVLLGAVCCVGV